MTPIKLPVTYSFFKKYTHHEELVEMMLKVKANGDEQTFKQLCQSNESKESALRQYYEAFYLKPKIREKFPIRFKAIPQKIKDKLLIIPVQDTKSDDKQKKIEEENNACPLQNVLKEFDINRKCDNDKREVGEQRIMKASKQLADEEEQMVEDDSEPLDSPDVYAAGKETYKSPDEKQIMTTELKSLSPQKASCSQDVNAASKTPNKKPKMATELEASSPRNASQVYANNTQPQYVNNAQDLKQISTEQKNSSPAAMKTKSTNFNYKNLLRYKHCCPLTYEEFCKYCNVNLLVKDFCQKHNVDIKKERMILKRTYIEFYLAPERRKLPPLNKIQLINNCPNEIKNKFFAIPTNIYLEEEKGELNKNQEQLMIDGAKVVNDKGQTAVINVLINSSNEQQIIRCSAIETATCNKGTVQITGDVLNKPTSSCQTTTEPDKEKINILESLNTNNGTSHQSINTNLSKSLSTGQNQTTSKTENINTLDSPDNKTCQNRITNSLMKPKTSGHTAKSSEIEKTNELVSPKNNKAPSQTGTNNILNKATSSKHITNTNASQEISKCPTLESSKLHNEAPPETVTSSNNILSKPQSNITTPSSQPSTISSTINIPISLEEFKKYSYYEEIIEKLIKLKAQDNHELFMKYKNSSEAFDLTLNNYYRAFYLKPFIRDIFPIRFKALPNFIKNRLLKIPEGLENETLNDFRIEQLVEPDFSSEVVKEMKIANDDADNPPVNQRITNEASPTSSTTPTNTTVITIKTEKDIETSDCDNKMNSTAVTAAGKKRTINEDMKTTSNKRQKIQPDEVPDYIENTEKIRKSHKDLLPYAHCCPITFSEFRNYTNVTELFRNFCQKRYNSLDKLPFMLKRAHLLYYLAPENRNYKPLNKLKILPQCPEQIRKKIFEIPNNLYLKGEKCNENVIEKSIKQVAQEQRNVLKEQCKENVNEEQEIRNKNKSCSSKGPIEILENRLLPPTTLTLITNSNKDSNVESLQCLNNNCVFNFISLLDFTQLTDILFLLPQSQEISIIERIFKKFIYKLLNQQNFNVKLMINGRLICKLLIRKEICENCLQEIKLLIEKDTILPSRKLQTESEHPLSNCIFYHISHLEFIELTNISYLIFEPQEISITKFYFKKLIYKLIKQQNCSENLVGSFTLWNTLLAHQDICEKCDNEIQLLIKEETSNSARELETKRNLNTCQDQVNDRSHLNNEKISVETTEVDNTEGNDVNYERTESALENPMNHLERSQQYTEKSAKPKSTESITENSQHKQNSIEKSHSDLWKSLKTDKIFNKFRSKLLAKLKESDKFIDFCAETYKIFLQCNEIPLIQILNDFCENNEDIVQRILHDELLCEALTRHYYSKYMTNAIFAEKYPVKLKENINSEQQITKTGEDELNGTNRDNLIRRKSVAISKMSLEQQEIISDEIADNNDIEKAKRIFFRSVEKDNTLSYILRTSFGLKQKILQTILSLTFQEFLEISNIYEGYELYGDNHIVECMYRYVFRTPLVWPTNLYINLKNLCEFLHSKNIRFNDYATMLKYISPKILHWSALLSCTNIVECVKIDYENRTGKSLNSNGISLKEECIVYYNRCWKQEKWLGQIPRVNEEFYREYVNKNNEDVKMLDESGLQEICEKLNESDNNELLEKTSDPNFATEITVQDNNEMNTSSTDANQSFKEFNCIILPNTQQQIEMLPAEERVSNDPLNNNTTSFNLDISMGTNENSNDVVSLGELIGPNIKTESINSKLLNNLVFYEDESSNIHCKSFEDEIIDLDATRTEILDNQLPPSQIDFEDLTHEIRLSNELITSGSSDNIINFGQRLPSSNESIESKRDNQPQQQLMGITTTQLPQLPDITLRSSGEEDNNKESSEQKEQQLMGITSTQLPLLPDVTLRSSGEEECIIDNNKESPQLKEQLINDDKTKQLGSLQSVMETSTALQSFMTFPNAQRFPSTFEDLQTFSGNKQQQDENQSHFKNTQNTIQDNVVIPMVRIEVQQQETTSTQSKQDTIATIKTLPLRRCMSKNVAKVKPLKNSDYVPQIQHNTRPLLTKPVQIARSTSKEQTQQTEKPKSQELSPIIIQTPNSETIETAQNSNVQIQQSPLGTHIFISQELNTNCSVFNNTSLLRIVDHNYQHSTSTTTSTQTSTSDEAKAENTQTGEEEDQLSELPATRKVTQKSSMLIASQQNQLQTETNKTTQIIPAKRVTRRSSLCKDFNNKANSQNDPNIPKSNIGYTIFR
ncbi:telomere ends associated isoform 2-T2 [Cochliomyia hominivorax]